MTITIYRFTADTMERIYRFTADTMVRRLGKEEALTGGNPMTATQFVAAHISLMAAPIYAALLAQRMDIIGDEVPPVQLAEMHQQAITQAQALWLATLECHNER